MYFNNPGLLSTLLKPNVPSTAPTPDTANSNGLLPGTSPNSLVAAPPTKGDPISDEMKVLYKRNLPYDNKPAIEAVRAAAAKTGINPALLFSSAFQEGFNKAIVKPNEASGAFTNAQNGNYDNGNGKKGLQPRLDTKNYPVDGFFNYGLDTFADKFPGLVKKGYLPKDFDFKPYKAYNEKNELVNTGAFKNNQDALTAKAAFIRDTADQVSALAKQKGIQLDDKAKNYFTLAAYNGGLGNAQKMLNEYSQAKDKNAFIDEGQTTRKGVHKNIYPRLQRMQLAQQLLDSK